MLDNQLIYYLINKKMNTKGEYQDIYVSTLVAFHTRSTRLLELIESSERKRLLLQESCDNLSWSKRKLVFDFKDKISLQEKVTSRLWQRYYREAVKWKQSF